MNEVWTMDWKRRGRGRYMMKQIKLKYLEASFSQVSSWTGE